MRSSHVIGRQYLKLRVSSQSAADRVFAEAGPLAQRVMRERAARVLDGAVGGEEHYTIERLTVRLGEVPLEQFRRVFEREFPLALARALQAIDFSAAGFLPGDQSATGAKRSGTEETKRARSAGAEDGGKAVNGATEVAFTQVGERLVEESPDFSELDDRSGTVVDGGLLTEPGMSAGRPYSNTHIQTSNLDSATPAVPHNIAPATLPLSTTDQLLPHATSGTPTDLAKVAASHRPYPTVDLVIHLLTHGSSPWWAAAQLPSLDELMATAMREGQQQLLTRLPELLSGNHRAAERLTLQVNSDTLALLVSQRDDRLPTSPPTATLISGLTKLHAAKSFRGGLTQRQLERAILTATLQSSGTATTSAGRRRGYEARLFAAIARLLRLEPEVLARDITERLTTRTASADRGTEAAILRLATSHRPSTASEEVREEARARQKAQRLALVRYLRYGTLPASGGLRSQEAMEAYLVELLGSGEDRFGRSLALLMRQPAVSRRMHQTLNLEVLDGVHRRIWGAEWERVEAYVDQFVRLTGRIRPATSTDLLRRSLLAAWAGRAPMVSGRVATAAGAATGAVDSLWRHLAPLAFPAIVRATASSRTVIREGVEQVLQQVHREAAVDLSATFITQLRTHLGYPLPSIKASSLSSTTSPSPQDFPPLPKSKIVPTSTTNPPAEAATYAASSHPARHPRQQKSTSSPTTRTGLSTTGSPAPQTNKQPLRKAASITSTDVVPLRKPPFGEGETPSATAAANPAGEALELARAWALFLTVGTSTFNRPSYPAPTRKSLRVLEQDSGMLHELVRVLSGQQLYGHRLPEYVGLATATRFLRLLLKNASSPGPVVIASLLDLLLQARVFATREAAELQVVVCGTNALASATSSGRLIIRTWLATTVSDLAREVDQSPETLARRLLAYALRPDTKPNETGELSGVNSDKVSPELLAALEELSAQMAPASRKRLGFVAVSLPELLREENARKSVVHQQALIVGLRGGEAPWWLLTTGDVELHWHWLVANDHPALVKLLREHVELRQSAFLRLAGTVRHDFLRRARGEVAELLLLLPKALPLVTELPAPGPPLDVASCERVVWEYLLTHEAPQSAAALQTVVERTAVALRIMPVDLATNFECVAQREAISNPLYYSLARMLRLIYSEVRRAGAEGGRPLREDRRAANLPDGLRESHVQVNSLLDFAGRATTVHSLASPDSDEVTLPAYPSTKSAEVVQLSTVGSTGKSELSIPAGTTDDELQSAASFRGAGEPGIAAGITEAEQLRAASSTGEGELGMTTETTDVEQNSTASLTGESESSASAKTTDVEQLRAASLTGGGESNTATGNTDGEQLSAASPMGRSVPSTVTGTTVVEQLNAASPTGKGEPGTAAGTTEVEQLSTASSAGEGEHGISAGVTDGEQPNAATPTGEGEHDTSAGITDVEQTSSASSTGAGEHGTSTGTTDVEQPSSASSPGEDEPTAPGKTTDVNPLSITSSTSRNHPGKSAVSSGVKLPDIADSISKPHQISSATSGLPFIQETPARDNPDSLPAGSVPKHSIKQLTENSLLAKGGDNHLRPGAKVVDDNPDAESSIPLLTDDHVNKIGHSTSNATVHNQLSKRREASPATLPAADSGSYEDAVTSDLLVLKHFLNYGAPPRATLGISHKELTELHWRLLRKHPDLVTKLYRSHLPDRASRRHLLRLFQPDLHHALAKVLLGSDYTSVTRLWADLETLLPRQLPNYQTTSFRTLRTEQLFHHPDAWDGGRLDLTQYTEELLQVTAKRYGSTLRKLHQKLVAATVERSAYLKTDWRSLLGGIAKRQRDLALADRQAAAATAEQQSKHHTVDAGMHVHNAGLVLLSAYLPRYFGMLGLLEERVFRNETAAIRGALLLEYLASGRTEMPEHELLFNKVLCGLPLNVPLPVEIELTDQERTVSEQMLKGILQHWDKMSNSTVDNLRASFLLRPGLLLEYSEVYTLDVVKHSFDVLLRSLPWGYTLLKHPWMPRRVEVTWDSKL